MQPSNIFTRARVRASEQGKVIGVGVHIYIYIYVCLWLKKIESYFSDRLTFSNIRGRTSR